MNPNLPASLEKFIVTEDVVIEDVSAAMGEWLVVGAKSTSLSFRACEESQISSLDDSRDSSQARNDNVFPHPLGLGIIGVAPGPVTVSPEQLEILRIEAGIPKWGVDMDENTIPNEAGLEKRAISYEKGCYIGQETIARIKTYGHVNRRLVQLQFSPSCHPERGEGSQSGETEILRCAQNDNVCAGARILANDKEIGHVTSVAYSNRLGKMLALGYVRREFATAGVRLTVGEQSAEVLRIL